MRSLPISFLHVPKCAGASLSIALYKALPPQSLAPFLMEPATLFGFDRLHRLHPDQRATIAATEAEIDSMRNYAGTIGHFTLPTLLRVTSPERIATVLREPRARLISHYLYLRFKGLLRTLWEPWGIHHWGEGPIAAFLGDRRAAPISDNLVCRMLLHGDPRIPRMDFIAEDDVGPLAQDALLRLQQLGFVGLIEEPEEVWSGIGAHFGVELEPVRVNVTGEEGDMWPGLFPVPPLGGGSTLELLEHRSAADAIVHRSIAAQTLGETGARRLADAAFAEALVRFGSFTTVGADPVVVQSKAMLDAVHSSRSWRYTAPLRRIVQWLR